MLEMPPRQFAEANGVRLAYYDAGQRDDPTPFVFCHGWPEIAFTWRRQIKGLSEAGFRAIALDQRGYGASDCPPAVEDYAIEHLADDVAGLLDHLKIGKAILVGHDWGGFVVWETALRHPDRVAGVVSLNTPHLKRAPADPIAILRKRHGERMYIVQFQMSREPDRIFAENVDRLFDGFLRRPLEKAVGAPRRTSISFPSFRLTIRRETAGHASSARRSGGASSMPSNEWLFGRDQLVSQHHPQLGTLGGPRPRPCMSPLS